MILILAFYLVLKKEEFATYYLFGQFAIVCANIFHTREMLGILPMHSFTSVVLPLGITIDALFLLWIVFKKSKKAYIEQQNQKEFLIEQLRYVSIGQAIGGVVHQWNSPLTHIGNVVTLLETTLKFDKQNLEPQMQKYLPELVLNIDFMSKTSQEILGHYTKNLDISEFFPKDVLETKVLKILSSKLTLKTAHITYDIKDDFALKMDENIFQNIMMILIDNSLDAIDKDGKINISIKYQDENTLIKYLDNCGGIQIELIEKIFEYNFSTKNDGHGIGLAILKMLVKEKLKGDIKVENNDSGTLFTIILPR
jgi:signal transduction histidine kinase